MNDSDHRDEIVRFEAQIDELAARIESCRKFILAGRIAVVGGSVIFIATVVGAIQFSLFSKITSLFSLHKFPVRLFRESRRKSVEMQISGWSKEPDRMSVLYETVEAANRVEKRPSNSS